jgi:isocitrate dehydrogenase (NAD+)
MDTAAIERAKEHFGKILENQMRRVERIAEAPGWVDYALVSPLKIGILAGDGIGPVITAEAKRVLEHVFAEEIRLGKIVIRDIEGLTIENRAARGKTIPDDIMEEIRKYHVTLKGPTYTPRKGDPWPNLESCNVAMRKELDLFANIRPVRIPKQGVDWIFFRENTEDLYALGPYGFDVDANISMDFRIISTPGAERICRLAFEHARKNGRSRVTCVTKANIIKITDGRFLDNFYRVAKEYPGIQADDWYIDIMTAKLVDEKRRRDFQVVVLPNLYGDILTDEAAEFQGGVGTAGSSNVGKQYAMFEAIHGSAPRMVEEGRAKYADPSSMIRAASMLVGHIGRVGEGRRLEMALDICGQYEKRLIVTGRPSGASGADFTNYVMEWLDSPKLAESWERYVQI